MSRIDDLKRLYATRGIELTEREANLVDEAWRMAAEVSRENAKEQREIGFSNALLLALLTGIAVGSVLLLASFY